jgi:hypothetical protein
MSLLTTQNGAKKPTNKTVFRNTTRCLKLTEDEARLVDEVATAKGIPRSEWMRDVILRELRCESAPDPSLAEVVGVRLLLVNILRPLAAGQSVSLEAFDKLLDQISTLKHEIAGKLLAERKR